MNFSDHEADLNSTIFDVLAEDAHIIHSEGEIEAVRIEITEDMQVRDDNGFIKETRCEIGLPVSVNPKRGLQIKINSTGKRWRLHQLISNDGYESRWVALPYD